ncbi:MAG: AarF/UbiB family protein [Bdellovibrionia bacterium]
MKSVLVKFQNTGRVPKDAVFNIYLSSSNDHQITTTRLASEGSNFWNAKDMSDSVRAFNIVIPKGLFDLLTDPVSVERLVAMGVSREFFANSEGMIAALIAHEAAHIATGDHETNITTTQVHKEYRADEFALRILFESGYLPESFVQIMTVMDFIQRDRTTEQVIAEQTNSHPKPRFRIANVTELTNTLRDRQRARVEFGLTPDRYPAPRAQAIVRTADERTSRTSAEGLRVQLGSARYLNLSLREKLTYLKEYLTLSNSSRGRASSAADRMSVVAIAAEFKNLLGTAEDLDTISQIIDNLKEFEESAKGAIVTDEKPEANSKKALNELKGEISNRINTLVETGTGKLSVENMKKWAPQIDRRVLLGQVMNIARNSSSLAELKELANALQDAKSSLYSKIYFGTEREHRKTGNEVYERIAVRALYLTGNMSQVLDFLQETVKITTADQAYGKANTKIEGLDYILAGLTLAALQKGDVVFGDFNERLDNPRSPKDRIWSMLLPSERENTGKVYAARRGQAPGGEGIPSYGRGRPLNAKAWPTPDLLVFLNRSLPQEAVKGILAEIINRPYSPVDILNSLVERGQEKEFWRSVLGQRRALGLIDVNVDFESALKAVAVAAEKHRAGSIAAEVLAPRGLNKLNDTHSPVSADLNNMYRSAGAMRSARVQDVLELALRNHSFKAYQTETGRAAPTQVADPVLDSQNLSKIRPRDRVAVYERLAHSQLLDASKKAATGFESWRTNVESVLTTLVREGALPETAKNDYMTTLDRAANGVKSAETSNGKLSADFYAARRTLFFMNKVLSTTVKPLEELLPKETFEKLMLLDGSSNEGTRYSAAYQGVQLVNNLMVTDRNMIVDYLQNPTPNHRALEVFALAGSLARLAARFEGLADLQASANIEALSVASTLTKFVTFPQYVRPMRLRSNTYDTEPDYTVLVSEAEQKILTALPESFWEVANRPRGQVQTSSAQNIYVGMALESLWALHLERAVSATDPIEALVHTISFMTSTNGNSNEEVTRTYYALLTRSLNLVTTQAEMKTFISYFGHYLAKAKLGDRVLEFLNADIKKLGDVSAMRYREHFYDALVRKLTSTQSWAGLEGTISGTKDHILIKIARYFAAKAEQYAQGTNLLGDAALPFRLWVIRGTVGQALTKSRFYQKFMSRMVQSTARYLTKTVLNDGEELEGLKINKLFEVLRSNTPWSLALDEAIEQHIKEGALDKWTKNGERKAVVNLLQNIRSMEVRSRAYEFVLKKYSWPSAGPFKRLGNQIDFWKAAYAASSIWTRAVLERLRSAETMYERWSITEQAWQEHAAERANRSNMSRVEAWGLLVKVNSALNQMESPITGEISNLFPEGSRHRDEFLEKYAKTHAMDFEQLKQLEKFKSQNQESPYHVIGKTMFELLDEYTSRLTPMERAQLTLYLAGFEKSVSPELNEKIKDIIYGGGNRGSAAKERGYRFSIREIRQFLTEPHPEERLAAYRAMFVGKASISDDPKAEKLLIDRLLMADSTMPRYLRRALEIYLEKINSSERSILLSWLLANGNKGALNGPEILRLLVEKGGVATQKLAQLIASHGFNLSREYQDVLEVFKGKAQKVAKIGAMKLIEERLPRDKFLQIKSLDRELGSGSLKLAYVATLKDGRKIVIKLARDEVVSRTLREFEILRAVIDSIMADPELHIDNLPTLRAEVERIIRQEINFLNEYRLEGRHKRARDARPILVRMFGSNADVYIPQPLEGWNGEGIMAEEFVNARKFGELPATGLFGWTKERLAKAAIDEVMNQMLAYLAPGEHEEGKIVIDIDPHEDNELAKNRIFRKMVDIDMGQSVEVEPEAVRGFARILLAIYMKNTAQAVEHAKAYMVFKKPEDVETFREELITQMKLSGDPIEVLTKTIEVVEPKGIMIVPDNLFFQKLFATLVGLKKSIGDKNYLLHSAMRILTLRGLAAPVTLLREAGNLKGPAARSGSAGQCSRMMVN